MEFGTVRPGVSSGGHLALVLNDEILLDLTVPDSPAGPSQAGISGFIKGDAKALTLDPGDIVATLTSSEVGYVLHPSRLLESGDIVKCQIGSLEHTVG
jgi:hypothetical protein